MKNRSRSLVDQALSRRTTETKAKEKLTAAFRDAAYWATKRATVGSSREQFAADLREWRELLASAADILMKKVAQSSSREEAIRRFWQSWVVIAELEAAIKARKSTSLIYAKIISRDLKVYANTISGLAERGKKQFFIDLGKCLSGEIKSAKVDRQKCDIASIVCSNPSISAKQAVRELKKRCQWEMSEEDRHGHRRFKPQAYLVTSVLHVATKKTLS